MAALLVRANILSFTGGENEGLQIDVLHLIDDKSGSDLQFYQLKQRDRACHQTSGEMTKDQIPGITSPISATDVRLPVTQGAALQLKLDTQTEKAPKSLKRAIGHRASGQQKTEK